MQQRAEFAGGGDEPQRMDLGDQACIVGVAAVGVEVRADTVSQVAGLADVERLAARTHEDVDTRRLRQGLERSRGEVGRRGRLLQQFSDRRGECMGVVLAMEHVEEVADHARVAQRTVAVGGGQAMAVDQRVESVAAVFGEEAARQSDGAQDLGAEALADATVLGLDEAVVEAGVVGDEDPAGKPR